MIENQKFAKIKSGYAELAQNVFIQAVKDALQSKPEDYKVQVIDDKEIVLSDEDAFKMFQDETKSAIEFLESELNKDDDERFFYNLFDREVFTEESLRRVIQKAKNRLQSIQIPLFCLF